MKLSDPFEEDELLQQAWEDAVEGDHIALDKLRTTIEDLHYQNQQMVIDHDRRVSELLGANNKYLEEARQARREKCAALEEGAKWKRKFIQLVWIVKPALEKVKGYIEPLHLQLVRVGGDPENTVVKPDLDQVNFAITSCNN